MIKHPAFMSQPNKGQFSKNGMWEDAWAFPQHIRPSQAQIRDYLAGATEIAFEAFLAMRSSAHDFLDLRMTLRNLRRFALTQRVQQRTVRVFFRVFRKTNFSATLAEKLITAK